MTYDEIIGRMQQIHSAKAHDYSPGEDDLENFSEAKRVGVSPCKACFIRLQDKYTRCCNLLGGMEPQVKGENIEDTLIDLANYAILTLVLFSRAIERREGVL